MKESIRIAALIGDYLSGAPMSPELEAWLAASERHRELFRRMLQGDDLSGKLDFYDSLNMDEEWASLQKKRHPKPRFSPVWRWACGAAAVLIPLFILRGYGWWGATDAAHYEPFDGSTVMPGRTVATLTIGESEFSLDGTIQVDASSAAGVSVKDSTGATLYASSSAETKMSRLYVPRGGEYHMVLEDGTKVWVNADTEIRFPEHFGTEERRIAVHGEAYLEVAKDSHKPFYVELGSTVVHVTGTALNVCRFDGDAQATVTLAEGRVQMERPGGEVLARLQPAEQFVIDEATQQYKVEVVDLAEALAWRHGLFLFNDEPLPAIARKLERWYNIEIEVDASLVAYRYSGELNRYASIQPLLNVLRRTGELEIVQSPSGAMKIVPVN